MSKTLVLSLLTAAVLVSSAAADTRIQVNIGNAPPPPAVVYDRRPPLVYVPEAQVYVVDRSDAPYDCFRFGAYFYIFNDGWWYRARHYRGPYTVIEERYVPRPIWRVPEVRWKHHPHGMPPGQAKKLYGDQPGWGDEHGHGHGRGHDKGDR